MDGDDLVLLHAIGVHGLILLAVPSVLLARTAMSRVRRAAPPLALAALALCAVAVAAADVCVARALPQREGGRPLDHAEGWGACS
jgi:hypothetical protein